MQLVWMIQFLEHASWCHLKITYDWQFLFAEVVHNNLSGRSRAKTLFKKVFSGTFDDWHSMEDCTQ